jgi:hypothetical protein
MRDLPTPRHPPIRMLKIVDTAERLLYHHAANFSTEGDDEIETALEVIASGCRLDICLFMTDKEVREAEELALIDPQSPDALSDADKQLRRAVHSTVHVALVEELARKLEFFDRFDPQPEEHLRCCGDNLQAWWPVVQSDVVMRARTHGTRGTIFIDLIHGLRTDRDRRRMCDGCLPDLDEVLSEVYGSWWKKMSPYIRKGH